MQKYKDIQDFVRAITTGSGFPGVVVVDLYNDNVTAFIGDDEVFDFDEGSLAEFLADLLAALGVDVLVP